MTADDTTRRAAKVIYSATHRNTDPYSVPLERAAEKAARALAEAGLLAPGPLHVVTATNQFGESHRRWATEWEPVGRSEGDGRTEP